MTGHNGCFFYQIATLKNLREIDFFFVFCFSFFFVCSRVGSLLCLMNFESIFEELPKLLMRHLAIGMVCAYFGQSQEPPPHHSDVLEVSA